MPTDSTRPNINGTYDPSTIVRLPAAAPKWHEPAGSGPENWEQERGPTVPGHGHALVRYADGTVTITVRNQYATAAITLSADDAAAFAEQASDAADTATEFGEIAQVSAAIPPLAEALTRIGNLPAAAATVPAVVAIARDRIHHGTIAGKTSWSTSKQVDALSAAHVINYVTHYFGGGLTQFLRDYREAIVHRHDNDNDTN